MRDDMAMQQCLLRQALLGARLDYTIAVLSGMSCFSLRSSHVGQDSLLSAAAAAAARSSYQTCMGSSL